MNARLFPAAIAALCASLAAVPDAAACGCFTPPDPANPVVQAGERIVFARSGNTVTATIQIQYAGDAADFGWLLPLPSLPTLQVTSDEVFFALAGGTAPVYAVDTRVAQGCAVPAPGGGGDGNGGGGGTRDPNGPLVFQDSIGPYDYAVLKADDKTAMLEWLKTNHYFVPAGTDNVVAPYIHPGAYFLALRLKSGKSTGDLQPVVVTYASDLPMIPIVLTSVTAQPAMGVWVWMLGNARAIPRNYHHVVLNDGALLWPYSIFGGIPGGGGVAGTLPSNYYDVVGRAVKEAPSHHAFVTEYAAPMTKAKDAIFPPGQFGDLRTLSTLTKAADYLTYLREHQYSFSPAMIQILQKYIKQPPGLLDFQNNPVTPGNYYYNFSYWYGVRPTAFQGFDLSFDAAALTAELDAKMVKPVRMAAADFAKWKYVTRLFTRLDPSDMTADPVFSENPDLPEVANAHKGTLDVTCKPNDWQFQGVLQTEQGFRIGYPGGAPPSPYPSVPAALRIETLRESGAPVVAVDNVKTIAAALAQTLPPGDPGEPGADGGTGGDNMGKAGAACNVGSGAGTGGGALLVAAALIGLGVRRRRR